MKVIILVIVAVAIAVTALAFGVNWYESRPGELDEFANCLETEGAEFYGAFWCPACAEQKALFGRSVDELPYIECSNADRSVTEVCLEEEIETYPTWKFSDGTILTGVQSLERLGAQVACELPVGA